jgi:UPF0716 protein FxsA
MAVLLIVLFLVVPVVEIYVIVQVGQEIGALPTVALLIIESLIGAWLVRREGRRAWDALRTAVGTGRLPGGELADAALVLVGGTLLLTPGFVSDLVGFLLILPLTRPLARRALGFLVAGRIAASVGRFGTVPPGWSPAGGRPSGPSGGAAGRRGGPVVQGEVVRDDVLDDDGPDPDAPRRGEIH